VFGGGGLTNEKAYTLGKLARIVLRTPFIDYNGRFCMSSAAAAANRTLGVDRGLTFPLADLAGADAVLVVGSNPAATMPPLVQHLAGVRAREGLVVVDPRASATARLTDDGGGIHLAPVPGTDLVVLLALTHVLVDEGLVDEHYVATRTTGWDAVRASVSRWWPERAEAVCGIPADVLRSTARRLASAAPVHGGRGAYVLTGRGIEHKMTVVSTGVREIVHPGPGFIRRALLFRNTRYQPDRFRLDRAIAQTENLSSSPVLVPTKSSVSVTRAIASTALTARCRKRGTRPNA